MNKVFYILLSLYTNSLMSQDFGEPYPAFLNSKGDIIRDLRKKSKEANETIESQSLIIQKSEDTLVYTLNSAVDGFTIYIALNITEKGSKKRYCGWQEIVFKCTPCAEEHLKSIIKKYKFKLWENDTYLSDPFWNTFLTVKYEPNTRKCYSLIYETADFTAKEHKKLYNSLPAISK